ncbi:putative ATP-dependent endonuclease of OLD family [Acinetobacter baylyi]|uniref:ATP-dependent endonuclease of OLD family n=1 Tax=Acinetobacter baylyi TaxID=202950 RepID=A0ABU0UZB2_ACIBI|nr:ATP-binding protein [Acinetobacter baylyi]MDQ1209911.1 putative ATP-dependent endonuclease of OLD family [Acinetobacter baylyi]MDR6106493.1 putative ATP-dependent endonuclease of OLD family [Acinetobacter baylyi]MDR6186780.1 putative ATP-dependent endonuclease of OLD family [Acinetobacter baylyi]
MIISKLYIKNFRGYKEQTIYLHDNLNVIIGKNDVGKSTILEALEIFFNNELVKIDVSDLSKKRELESDSDITIQVSFQVAQGKSYTIDTVPTYLTNEYLLDSEKFLTIRKVWSASTQTITAKSLKTFIVSDYPNKKFVTPLVNKKISELKKDLALFDSSHDTSSVNKAKSSSIRQAIYNFSNVQPIDLSETFIPIDAEDGKKIYEAIKSDFPLYFLFKADRENKDSDTEVQSPLKVITKSILANMQTQLDELKAQIVSATEEVGQRTITKLREMNPEIADQLIPNVSTKAWDTLFSFTFEDEAGIPINKRGSGVRRLILLNYFRAEAERKRSNDRTVIYALEEPETAQHPDWQVMLYSALVELSEKADTQIFLTTHSPSLGSLVPLSNIIYLYKQDKELIIETNDVTILEKVTESLGITPDIMISKIYTNIKLIICMEGPTDIEFLKNISISCFNFDLSNHPQVLLIPLGGGNLEHWVTFRYLDKLPNISQIHIYDRDVKKYGKFIQKINQNSLHKAFQTNFYEIENYIHPSLYSNCYQFSEPFIDFSNDQWKSEWNSIDVPKKLSQHLKYCFENGDRSLKEYSSEQIKKKLNYELSKVLTKDLLKDIGAYEEISSWIQVIQQKVA